MSKRRTGRKLAMQVLYQADMQQAQVKDVLEKFIEPSPYVEETKTWATTLALGVSAHQGEIDSIIMQYAIGWDLHRIAGIDRNILRIAFYEMVIEKSDPRIAINEALEIAKKYATDDSPKFINGILGAYVHDHPYSESVCSPASSKQ